MAAMAAGLLYFGTVTDNDELSNLFNVKELDNTADWAQLTARQLYEVVAG